MSETKESALSRARYMANSIGMMMAAMMLLGVITRHGHVLGLGIGLGMVAGMMTSYRLFLANQPEDAFKGKSMLVTFLTRDWTGVIWISAAVLATIAFSVMGVSFGK